MWHHLNGANIVKNILEIVQILFEVKQNDICHLHIVTENTI